MNTYKKFCPNVYVALCDAPHEKGDVIEMTTKYGKTHDAIVFNKLPSTVGTYLYSVVRADGYNVQERAKAKAARYEQWSASATEKSNSYYQASREGSEFLSMGEPIKVGHHSETRHRNLIGRNWDRMGKSVEFNEKAEDHLDRAAYWESRADEINLSMPESIDYYEAMVEKAKATHQGIKDGTIPREHAYSLPYAKKAVNDAEKNFALAIKLWG